MPEHRTYSIGYVMVREFIRDREGVTIGIRGLRWPDGRSIEVRQEELFPKSRQTNFESLRKPTYHDRALECGGMVRMRLFADPLHSARFTADNIHLLTTSQYESEELMRFGHGQVRIFTPQEVTLKRRWLEKSPQGKAIVDANLAKAQGVRREDMLENLLAQELPGRERYRALCYLFNADASMQGSPREESLLRDNLLTFFQLPEMQPVITQASLGYRPVKPYLLVRSLDPDNRVRASFAFHPSDAEQIRQDKAGRLVAKHFLTPEECVAKIVPRILQCPRFDVLPCMVYPFSMEQMRMGEGYSDFMIRKVARMNQASHLIDAQGGYHPLVREMGLKLAPGGSYVIVESLFDKSLPACEPELLAREHQRYTRSPKPLAQEKDVQHDSQESCEAQDSALRPGW
ncbi:MAG: hypothetical protein IKN64_10975 [Desulfovibrio sp.]|nr:hypothetical protein [Desulfovibrio sp.]